MGERAAYCKSHLDGPSSPVQAPDGRGQSVTCVLLRGASLQETYAVIHGVLADGRTYETRLPTLGGPEHGSGGDLRVGTELEGGWWVKAKLSSPGSSGEVRYHCCRGKGRAVEYKEMMEEELKYLLLVHL